MQFEFTEILGAGDMGYAEFRIPGIVAHKGEIVMCCEARSRSGDDWGKIDILILGEEGVRHRFTSDKEYEVTLNNPTLISSGSTLHLIYHANYARAFHLASMDEGRTWSRPEDITSAYREFGYDWNVCATGPGHGIQLDSGRLIAPIWLAMGKVVPGNDYRVLHYPSVAGAIYSDDNGATWHAGALIGDTGGIVSANETSVCQLETGEVLFNIRHRGVARRRAGAVSADGGKSVSDPYLIEELPDPMCFGALAEVNGEALYCGCASKTRREHLTISRLRQGSWAKVHEFPGEAGYADIANMGGRICVLYECGSGSRVLGLSLAKQIKA